MENKMMKMREAVKALLDAMYDMGIDEDTVAIAAESTTCHINSPKVLEAIRNAKSALSEPPLQCDVGTPGEQAERFEEYCQSRWECREDCPIGKIIGKNDSLRDYCQLLWAQMPYAAQEGAVK